MLCPFSTGKSAANWLDRLRSSKGFTLPSPDLSLDQFLLNSTPNPPTDDASDPPSEPTSSPFRDSNDRSASPPMEEETEGEKEELANQMRAALADLFHMDSPGRCNRPHTFRDRRSARKQGHPRFCVASYPGSAGGSCPSGMPAMVTPAAMSPSIANNGGVKLKRKRTADGKLKSAGKKKIKKHATYLLSAAGENKREMSSRTDVTVIDTSCSANWKSAKIIFRKGTAWKVRDKKKWCLMRKERKFGLVQRTTTLNSSHGSQQVFLAPTTVGNSNTFTRLAEGSKCDPKGDLANETIDDRISFPEIRLQFSKSFRRARSKGHTVSHPLSLASESSNSTLPPPELQ